MAVKKIAAGSFKVHCLAVMDEVQAKRETVVITKRGKPVAKLVPVEEQTDDLFGFLRGKVTIVGDVVSPALKLEEWGSAVRGVADQFTRVCPDPTTSRKLPQRSCRSPDRCHRSRGGAVIGNSGP